jgi:hypothetical protein
LQKYNGNSQKSGRVKNSAYLHCTLKVFCLLSSNYAISLLSEKKDKWTVFFVIVLMVSFWLFKLGYFWLFHSINLFQLKQFLLLDIFMGYFIEILTEINQPLLQMPYFTFQTKNSEVLLFYLVEILLLIGKILIFSAF